MLASRTFRFVVTAIVVALAIAAGFFAWRLYVETPWTRDGRVRADVIQLAPEVSGAVAEVRVKDNQPVRKGDVLFVIDPERYRFALTQSEANVEARERELEQRRRELERRTRLSSAAITVEAREQAETAVGLAEAAYDEALAALNTARLNLDRTTVRSPANGHVTNLQVHVGDYAVSGKASLAVVNSDSFYVVGYFEETKLRNFREGDRAVVRLLGFPEEIEGHVESIARAIADRETVSGSGDLIANVNPTFSWVRLAQRIPVRIALDRVPDSVRLSAGMTATIVVHPQEGRTGRL
ncbi:efflux RND transporter periplasmic adaptor subunit [Microvirga rosea]|uniref:efflux RND transporter periplasmic adaptor subunit n=1 Tax=Microvirga rosea TaxID=2715425 RepID=UPI001D0AA123|nr:HlyD family secretion protein [Microvirga rosea]MCB8821498.1 HlyD family secretion protein [Microvirga rosea]